MQYTGRLGGVPGRCVGVAVFAAFACLGLPSETGGAEEAGQVLYQWPVRGAGLPAGMTFWRAPKPEVRAEAVADAKASFPAGVGAISVRVEASPGAALSDIQFSVTLRQELGRGGKYRVSFWAKASRSASIRASVLRDDPPWRPLAAESSTECAVSTEWTRFTLDFSPERDVTSDEVVRAPGLMLGQVAPGTTLWFAGFTLSELQPPPPPLPLLFSEQLLANPGFEAGLSGWTPQACRLFLSGVAASGKAACLATERTARWGTPIQEIRDALVANGRGFYEFGASLKQVAGSGQGIAVIHLRDDAGDRWFTTDPRSISDTRFATVLGQRYVTWTGTLRAAELGVQTVGENKADLVVDDVTLRALRNLARGRATRSSGDAPGSSPAQACDGDPLTGWTPASARDAWIEVDFQTTLSFNACVLREAEPRTRSYAIEVCRDGQWRTAFTGAGIFTPEDRLHFDPVTGEKARLRIVEADGVPTIQEFALYGTSIRERTVRMPVPAADPRRRSARTLVGAIRWDGWCGDRDPVGLDLERVLAPQRYHYRLPFYARILGPDKVEIRCVTQETVDREIAFAQEAGIDYWAFDWYPPDSGLALARALYLKSAHRNKVKWCAILATGAFTETDLSWLVEQFQTDCYQKVLGDRPLVYVFDASTKYAPLVKSLRDATAARGVPTPFVVFMGWGPAIADVASGSGADAIGSYVTPMGERNTFARNREHEKRMWESFRATGRQLVPTVTTGWDTRPFADCPVPWYRGASESNWVEKAEPEEIAAQLRDALDFVKKHPDATLANSVLIYAWNENAEGGWVVPTLFELRDAGYPARLDVIRSVLRPDVPRGSGWGPLVR